MGYIFWDDLSEQIYYQYIYIHFYFSTCFQSISSCNFLAVKYRLPSVLFATSVKQNNLIQAIESIPQHSLDVAEACNLHPSTEAVIGDDQYIFTR